MDASSHEYSVQNRPAFGLEQSLAQHSGFQPGENDMTRFGISTTATALIVGGVISMVFIGCSRSTTLSEGPKGSQTKAGVETPAVDQNEGTGKGWRHPPGVSPASTSSPSSSRRKTNRRLPCARSLTRRWRRLADWRRRIAVNITDALEKAIVAKFDLSGDPMPLVLTIAPDGAITGGFPTKFEEQQLLDAFAKQHGEVDEVASGRQARVRVRPERENQIQ